jgi:hypothetical protein
MHVPVAIHLGLRADQHIDRDLHAAQAPIGLGCPPVRRRVALVDDDQQVHVAIFPGLPPRVRAEQDDPFGAEALDQPSCHVSQNHRIDPFHL